jgi:hypothetical protein
VSNKAEKIRAMRDSQMSSVAPITPRETVKSVEIGKEEDSTPKEKKKVLKTESSDNRTEAIFARITKAEKRMLKMHTIDSDMKLQEVISAAITEYCNNHPL